MVQAEINIHAPVTLVEIGSFARAIASMLSADEIADLTFQIASNPDQGEIMPGTGGVRKIRWAIQGRGKRGGARVIYYYYDREVPIFLLTAFAKNERTDLKQAQKNELRKLVKELVSHYKR